MKYRHKTPRKVFTEIYRKNLWGGTRGQFDSGHGSVERCTEPYCTTLSRIINEWPTKVPVIVDLGCGDFRVAQRLLHLIEVPVKYVGVDIVPDLIEHNRKKATQAANLINKDVQLECIDIIDDPLPDGDICLIRQVLQHLSNAQIIKILAKLKQYRYIFITEHYPVNVEIQPNLDKLHGPDIRSTRNSAVYLDEPPFDEEIDLILTVKDIGFELRTFLIRN